MYIAPQRIELSFDQTGAEASSSLDEKQASPQRESSTPLASMGCCFGSDQVHPADAMDVSRAILFNCVPPSDRGANGRAVVVGGVLLRRSWPNAVFSNVFGSPLPRLAANAKGGSIAIEWPKTWIYWRLPEVQAWSRSSAIDARLELSFKIANL